MSRAVAMPALELAGLAGRYGDGPVVFGPLDAIWDDARVIWLQGPNGSGKSTILKVLAGALDAAFGTARLHAGSDRIDLRDDPLAWRRAVAWCPPEGPTLGHLNARQWLAFMAGLYPGFDPLLAAGHARAFGLDAHAHARLDALSSGTRRKVALAAALAAGTPLLLLDEPLVALDAAARAHLADTLGRWCTAQPARRLVVASHEPWFDGPTHADVARWAPFDADTVR